jgi:transcriptional regulator with XRE-family HTH domain
MKKNTQEIKENMKKIASRLKFIRHINYKTLNDVAKKINVTHQQIQKYEQGKTRFHTDKIADFSKTFNIDMKYFMNDEEPILSIKVKNDGTIEILNIDYHK